MWSITIALLLLLPNTAFTFTTTVPAWKGSPTRSCAIANQNNAHFLQDAIRRHMSLNAEAEAEAASSSYNNKKKEKKPNRISFEERMRGIALGRKRRLKIEKEPNLNGSKTNRPRNLQVVETLDEYKKIVGEEKEKLTVVRFFATWCKVSDSVYLLWFGMIFIRS